jgi:hypothetical protein
MRGRGSLGPSRVGKDRAPAVPGGNTTSDVEAWRARNGAIEATAALLGALPGLLAHIRHPSFVPPALR